MIWNVHWPTVAASVVVLLLVLLLFWLGSKNSERNRTGYRPVTGVG